MFKIKKNFDNGLKIIKEAGIRQIRLSDQERYNIIYTKHNNKILAYCIYVTNHVSVYEWVIDTDYVAGGTWLLKKHDDALHT